MDFEWKASVNMLDKEDSASVCCCYCDFLVK